MRSALVRIGQRKGVWDASRAAVPAGKREAR